MQLQSQNSLELRFQRCRGEEVRTTESENCLTTISFTPSGSGHFSKIAFDCNPLSSPNCNCILTELAVEPKVETHQWLFHWNPSVNNTSYLPFNFALLFFLQDTGFYIFIGNVTLQTFLSKIFILLHIYIQENVATLCVVLTNYNTLNTCFVSVWKTTFFSLVSLTMEITGINWKCLTMSSTHRH